jgi:hypothetical protein
VVLRRRTATPGPLPVQEIRQRFQRGQLNLDTLVWREGMAQWAALRQVVDELGLQTLADASTATASGGFDLRGDYAAIDNGTAPLPGTGALSSSPYSAPAAAGAGHRSRWSAAKWSTQASGSAWRPT